MVFNETQRRSFTKQGFMIVQEFLDKIELEIVRRACDREVKKIVADMRSKGISEQGINVLDRKYFINNARIQNPKLADIIFSEKTEALCRATIGETAYLHNEQFVVKMMNKVTSFAWHQDSGYSVYNGGAAPHEPYLTCWIALDDMSEDNGTISILPFPRYTSARKLLKHTWSDEVNAMVGYNGEDPGDLIEVPAGTLVAFSSRLLHKSGANTTLRPRRGYFIAFTPTLFLHQDETKGIYSQGNPLIEDGKTRWSRSH